MSELVVPKNERLIKVANDPDLMEERVQLWSEDFLLWFFDCVYTKDEGLGLERLSPRFKYIESLHRTVEGERIIWVEKSRQLFVTWYMVARFMWKLFYGKDKRLIYGSRVADTVKDVIKTRFLEIYNRLDRSFPIPRLKFTAMAIENPSNGMLLKGMSSTGDGSRGATGAELWLDEIAFQEEQEDLVQASLESVNAPESKLIGVTTPNPEPEASYIRGLIADSIDKEVGVLELSKGVTKKFNLNGHCVLSISHFAHPEKQEEWQAAKIKEIGLTKYLIEHGLQWEVAKGKPCFWGYSIEKHKKPVDFNEYLPLLIGLDPGTGHPAVTFGQKGIDGKCRVLWGFTRERCSITSLCEHIEDEIIERFNSHDDFEFFIDPAGAVANPHGTENAAEAIYKYFGKPVHAAPKSAPEDRARIINDFFIRDMILIQPDCGIYYHGDGRIKTDAFSYMLTTGYVLDARGKPSKAKDEKNGEWDHMADSFGYMFISKFSVVRDIGMMTNAEFSVRPNYYDKQVKRESSRRTKFLI